jgi:integrase
VYITDAVFEAVWNSASTPLRDALDLAYLTGQRPGDALKMTEHDISDGHLFIKQSKTNQKLQIAITGELAMLFDRIRARKASHKIVPTALLVNESGRRLTKGVLRDHFDEARKVAAESIQIWPLRSNRFGSTICAQKRRMILLTCAESSRQVIY